MGVDMTARVTESFKEVAQLSLIVDKLSASLEVFNIEFISDEFNFLIEGAVGSVNIMVFSVTQADGSIEVTAALTGINDDELKFAMIVKQIFNEAKQLKTKFSFTYKNKRFLRYVYNPYKLDNQQIKTPKQLFNYTRVYRPMTVDPDNNDRLIDIFASSSFGDETGVSQFLAAKLFFYGAEEDLDRYLAWLSDCALKNDKGVASPLIVVEQYVNKTAAELSNVSGSEKKDIRICYIMPNRVTDFGLLIGSVLRSDSKVKKEYIY